MPTVGLTGPLCSGKDAVVEYLETKHGFNAIFRLPQLNEDGEYIYRTGDLVLGSVDDLISYLTPRWRERFVINGIHSPRLLSALLKRPFFLLVYIDAPIMLRFNRYKTYSSLANTTLEEFCSIQDAAAFQSDNAGTRHRALANLLINNDSNIKLHLWEKLQKADLLNPNRFRPSWDSYFMEMASLAAKRSNCMKRRVGCVLVRGNRVIATGYNGTPRGATNCNEGGCPRCNSASSCGKELDTCLCLHAEENALLEAGRERVGNNAILYCDTCPCLTCSVKITQLGIKEVVYHTSYNMDSHTASLLQAAGVQLRQYIPPENSIF
ncbi:Deoxycytidylate deaminase [Schizosaccharomyces pombe]|uniref:Deoxycytidylate deaminase n=1 Tax=Schizosaccharomyces pombe (strain 972 / ATCC 24843) TaxID=284812 RepID=DCTD_SCHPO|nr:putative deoxycytidylate deaminase [Schizosaccharomyces pombe]O43012.2 RecName: Full=Deoxycytidylate deaminase; AltName: Full=dCMP deaminase [Schizosaccharomyces pombe 972h-]CAA17893.2 deoxycytidylate deaminase (predicted) [Schizosaccharomyces pombe]|eukprot:NP_596442.2 putative deoxycytidylate deaminase [Schizosaccharomyces pombe]